jgi:hypothetical protein
LRGLINLSTALLINSLSSKKKKKKKTVKEENKLYSGPGSPKGAGGASNPTRFSAERLSSTNLRY